MAAVALSLAGCGESNGPRATLPRKLPADFFGLVTEDAFAGSTSYRRRTLAREARMGVGLIRQTFDWSQIETARGHYDFARYDALVADAARAGMRVMPVVLRPPPFRSAGPRAAPPDRTYPPRRFGDLGRFLATLARRYGPRGSLWVTHDDLPRRPVRSWQVWNEPSLPPYWASGPDPAAYVRMLKAASAAVKRVDPGAVVVSAGLPQSRLGIPFAKFLNGMYDAGAASAFDVLAVHPYARDEQGVIAAVEEARDLMASRGDDAAIWVTELGWASGGPVSPFTAGKLGQAARIRRALSLLARRRPDLGVRGVVYYAWRDSRPYPPDFRDFWGLHTGLHDLAGRPKPALEAFRATVRRLLARYGQAGAGR
jgi:polysaccharide biosynthesis protein PslG